MQGSNSLNRNQGNKKEPSKKALNLNGGVDVARFELLIQNYVRNLVLYNKFEKILELSSKYSEILT